MKKNTIIIILVVLALFFLCSLPLEMKMMDEKHKNEKQPEESVIGITYGGKVGVDMGGFVIPFDGSPMEPGF